MLHFEMWSILWTFSPCEDIGCHGCHFFVPFFYNLHESLITSQWPGCEVVESQQSFACYFMDVKISNWDDETRPPYFLRGERHVRMNGLSSTCVCL